MSGVLLGRAVRCVGTAAAAVMLLCPAGPALGKFSVPAAPGDEGPAGGAGTAAAHLIAVPDGTAQPIATTSRACDYENSSVNRTPADDLRAAVVCLINHARARWHLPRLRAQAEVEQAAQGHTGQMVSINSLTHVGAGGSSPGARLDQAGYRWAAFGEILATGMYFATETARILGGAADAVLPEEGAELLAARTLARVGAEALPRTAEVAR